MGGIILWGKSSDLNDEEKCLKFYNYVIDIVGPALNESLTMGNKTNSTITTYVIIITMTSLNFLNE